MQPTLIHTDMINYSKLMSHNPTSFGVMMNDKGQKIEFFEHPILGDESDIICVCHELQLADYSGFWDTQDMTAEHGEYQPWFNEEGQLHMGDLGWVRD